ncbi:MAG: methyltransferase [Planctomycetota bacterium]|nr:MAG: methyltransferase [Planctomycetota bacterium]
MILPAVFPPAPFDDYALLDCGRGEKLERLGPYRLRRPDPQAMWAPAAPEAEWEGADLVFEREDDRGGHWVPGPRAQQRPPERWEIACGNARFVVGPTPFKHIGLFPEQAPNWAWTAQRVAALAASLGERPRLLNLFAYTGAATVLASQAGAFVTHVDASKPALRWARENAAASQLPRDAVRWIEDDAQQFVRRELRREKRYHGILLDPPPYGRGPSGERWVFEERIGELLAECAELLVHGPAFLLVSCYAVGTTPLSFQNLLAEFGAGELEAGELALPAEWGARSLPAGLCGRWSRGC